MEDTSKELETRLWQELPFELLEKVLHKLPVSTLMKFCLVSKRWKASIESAEFGRHCHSSKPVVFFHIPGLISREETRSGSYLAIPNTTSNSWEKHFLPFSSTVIDGIKLVAGDQGLLCFRSMFAPRNVVVYNPLTKRWKILTLPEGLMSQSEFELLHSRSLLGMVMDGDTGNYKLVFSWIGAGIPTKTLVYDSHSSSWTDTGAAFPALTFHIQNTNHNWLVGKGVCCAGSLYWLLEEQLRGHPAHFHALVKYNVKMNEWSIAQCGSVCRFPFVKFFELQMTTQNRDVVMMNWEDGEDDEVFPAEFKMLGPEIKPMDSQLAYVGSQRSNRLTHYRPIRGVAQGDLWYVAHTVTSAWLGSQEKPLMVAVLDSSCRVLNWLPSLVPGYEMGMGSFAATFNAFV